MIQTLVMSHILSPWPSVTRQKRNRKRRNGCLVYNLCYFNYRMESELTRLSTIIQQDRRRLSLMTEQVSRHSVVSQQPRDSIASRGESPYSEALTEMQKRRMSVRSLRRKSINPRLDPPPGLEGLADKGFIYVRQQMESDLRGNFT